MFALRSLSQCSFKLGNSDALHLGVVVFVVQTMALQRKSLHLVVVEGAHGIDVLSGGELLQLFGRVVNTKHLFDAVEVFANVVFVFKHTECSVNLVFVHFLIIIIYGK